MSVAIALSDLHKWADYLLDYSLGGIHNDDVVMIKGEPITWPLMSVLQDKVFAKGAVADINLVAIDNDRGKVFGAAASRHGSVEQIARTPKWHLQRYQEMTKYIEILGAEQPQLFTDVPAATAQALMSANEPFVDVRLSKPWVLTLFPTPAFAAMDNMSLQEYSDVIVGAATCDPSVLEAVEEPIYQAMHAASQVRVCTEHPHSRQQLELRLCIAERNIIKCTGKRNFPDGEVFTSPDANSVDGEIFVDMPVAYGGTCICGVYLRFADGKITEFDADQGLDALRSIIETDAGSRRLGEVAFGMNAGLTRVLRHPLFVEKVGGTMHIAIGASAANCYVDDPHSEAGQQRLQHYVNSGCFNKSAQHVDIVTDFRPGGSGRAVYLDNQELVVRDNIWSLA